MAVATPRAWRSREKGAWCMAIGKGVRSKMGVVGQDKQPALLYTHLGPPESSVSLLFPTTSTRESQTATFDMRVRTPFFASFGRGFFLYSVFCLLGGVAQNATLSSASVINIYSNSFPSFSSRPAPPQLENTELWGTHNSASRGKNREGIYFPR